MGKGPVVAGLVLLVIVVGGAFALTSSNKTNNTSSSSSTNSNSPNQSNKSTNSAAATITYDGNSFSPAKVTVKSGDSVEIKNTSNTSVQFDSDPHPVHTDDTDLNAGLVTPGSSKTFTVSKTGTFGYHNHLDPTQKGEIEVQ